MQLNLDEQKVAVIGAGHGIGRAIAEGFVAERCRVWTFDRDPSAAPLGQGNVTGDVTHYDEVRVFAESVGDVDHVVFSVGAGSGKFGFPFWNLEPADWARVLELNLIGAVNVAPYSAAKAGLINFTQCAAKDLAPHGIRVNALSPGMVKTDLNQSVWKAGQAKLSPSERQDYEAWAEEKIRKVSPLGRWQTPAEFAAMAVFLASDHAKNITGQTINIDGGQVMHA
jgi:2-hydroxycyclohexanecarboxyl-CoA dehydrogenase